LEKKSVDTRQTRDVENISKGNDSEIYKEIGVDRVWVLHAIKG